VCTCLVFRSLARVRPRRRDRKTTTYGRPTGRCESFVGRARAPHTSLRRSDVVPCFHLARRRAFPPSVWNILYARTNNTHKHVSMLSPRAFPLYVYLGVYMCVCVCVCIKRPGIIRNNGCCARGRKRTVLVLIVVRVGIRKYVFTTRGLVRINCIRIFVYGVRVSNECYMNAAPRTYNIICFGEGA